MDFTELRHLAEQIETECGKAIIGKGEQIRLVLTSLFAGGSWRESQKTNCARRSHGECAFGQGFNSPRLHQLSN